MQAQPWLALKYEALECLWSLCEDFDEQRLITQLLHRFTYIEPGEFDNCLGAMTTIVVDEWKLQPDRTLIAALHNDDDADSSQLIAQALKKHFAGLQGWSERHFFNSAFKAIHSANDGDNIVLVDDFVGTGNQANKVLASCIKSMGKLNKPNIKIFLLCIAAMEFSKGTVANLAGFYSLIWLKKGIQDYYVGSELDDANKKMLRLESTLLAKNGRKTMPSFGYRHSESLFGHEFGTIPNNVFPVFWWKWLVDKSERKTLFNRL